MLPRCRAAAAHPASPMPLRPPARLRRRSPVSQRVVRLRVVVRVRCTDGAVPCRRPTRKRTSALVPFRRRCVALRTFASVGVLQAAASSSVRTAAAASAAMARVASRGDDAASPRLRSEPTFSQRWAHTCGRACVTVCACARVLG